MKGFALVFAAFLLVLGACAPKPGPASTTPAAKPPLPTSQATPKTPNSQPEDSAWANVVAAAKKEGKVTAYTWAFTGDIGQTVFQSFESQYGIKVEPVTGVGSALLERIRSEGAAKKNTADTMDTSISILATAMNAGLLDSLADLPVLQQKDVWAFSPKLDANAIIIGAAPAIQTAFVNTNLVKPGEEPKSYRDLLSSKWAGGKIGIPSPVTAPALNYIYVFRKEYGLDDDYFRQLLKQSPKIVPTIRDGEQSLVRGETAIVMGDADTSFAPFVKEGAPIRPIEMEGGVIGNIVPGISLVKQAPHPNAARVFVNWLLSPEGQRAYGQAKVGSSMRKDVPDFSHPMLKMQPRKINAMTIDVMQAASKLQNERVVAKLLQIEN